ncbi:MAG: DUF4954 family protein [Bacteroidota bacterium]
MNKILKKPLHQIGYDFIVPPYLPEGKDEYYLRNEYFDNDRTVRRLSAYEIEILVKNENQADNWTDIYVDEKFDPKLVKNCRFHGMIRIGALESYYLEFNELQLPVGLYNSTIVSCDIGHNVVIMNVDYLAHYQIGNEVILFNINEMHATNHAKFGNGIVKEGEEEAVRIWIELGNENGGRSILPFDGITPADAYLWTKYRSDHYLMDRFKEMTEEKFDSKRGYYGKVGNRTVIKNTRILKDVKVGTDAYIKGGNKLKNLTINSSAEAPSQIGEGTEMVNGIMGYGSRAFYGIKAVRFIMGENTVLKYGARLINSYLGDNSTISCCEVLNSLIFPAHEQHHNNSFLSAAVVMGQSNIAAGATLGSNHNSRGADGELVAGRGFWPALCTSTKHNSRLASFILLAKADYPYDLNIPFPFALVSNNEATNSLQIMPAYWFMYNMYAIARNSWKIGARDKRKVKAQTIVSDYLAPDTIGEIFTAMDILREVIGKNYLIKSGKTNGKKDRKLRELGEKLIIEKPEVVQDLEIHIQGVESSRRTVRILKALQGFTTYRKMVLFYSIKTLMKYAEDSGKYSWAEIKEIFMGSRRGTWVNVGGQLMRTDDLEKLKTQIRERQIATWEEVHEAYDKIHEQYAFHNSAYAYASIIELTHLSESEVSDQKWKEWLDEALNIQKEIEEQTYLSRKKDFENPFRKATYETQEEMKAVLGEVEDNSFIRMIKKETLEFERRVKLLKERMAEQIRA